MGGQLQAHDVMHPSTHNKLYPSAVGTSSTSTGYPHMPPIRLAECTGAPGVSRCREGSVSRG